MSLRKQRRPRRSISADKGQAAELTLGLFFVLLAGILMCARIQLAVWETASAKLEDALAASNLAAALIDVEEYGKTHKTLIKDPSAAFAVYQDAVKENLRLDESWENADQDLICGPVEITDFVIYNVSGGHVEAVRVDRDGRPTDRWSGESGALKAPNGILVENTGVYSEIRFQVRGLFGIYAEAHKSKLVDIVAEEH